MTISDNIKALRLAAGLTQLQVSKLIKIPPKNYQYYELGGNPGPELLLKLSQLYEVSIECLIIGFDNVERQKNAADIMYLKFLKAPDNIQTAIKALLES